MKKTLLIVLSMLLTVALLAGCGAPAAESPAAESTAPESEAPAPESEAPAPEPEAPESEAPAPEAVPFAKTSAHWRSKGNSTGRTGVQSLPARTSATGT